MLADVQQKGPTNGQATGRGVSNAAANRIKLAGRRSANDTWQVKPSWRYDMGEEAKEGGRCCRNSKFRLAMALLESLACWVKPAFPHSLVSTLLFKWSSRATIDILQRVIALDVSVAPRIVMDGNVIYAKKLEPLAVKVGDVCHNSCPNMDGDHGDDEQQREAHTPYYHVKERKVRDGTGNASDCKKSRSADMGKVRRPLTRRSAVKALSANENHNESRNFPLLVFSIEDRHSEGRQKRNECCQAKTDGLFPHKKGRPQLAFELTTKSKLGNRSFRKNRGRRLRRSPTSQPRRNVQDLLYTGLITPSRRHLNWKISPGVYRLTSDALKDGGVDELDISDLPRSGCGTPWSWSRIHSKKRHNLLKMAGMGMPCRLSDSLTKNLGRQDSSSTSESSSAVSETSFNTDSESLPLLEPNSPLQDYCKSQSESVSWEQNGKMHQESNGASYMEPVRPVIMRGDGKPAAVASGHLSLNQKYMPKTFHDIVGQNFVTQALCNALSRGKIAPMYIFYGPRGTGKTSCAQIFAAALNCLSVEGQRPCGTCIECESGKYSKIIEYNVGGKNGTRGVKTLMHDVIWSSSAHYSVYAVNECHTLTSQSWDAFLKVVNEAPRNVVFILSTSSLEHIPHEVASRCQKFLFSKIKENEIVRKLQSIATEENMEADAEAIKLIASTCDGSLHDAEMMLDQLSLLGQNISISLVQELMGLIPDNKLVDLLDFALSADTINTVRSLKELMVSGAEPLNLMSQLACLITSILAGGFQIPTEMQRCKFFRQELTKEDMERLRQALKTLSEAEKQLRDSSDRTTWLTAALLQFAPDQSYLVPRSSSNTTSVGQTPEGPSDTNGTQNLKPFSKRRPRSHSKHLTPTHMESGPGTTTECASNEMSDSSRFSLASSQAQVKAKTNQKPKGVRSTASEVRLQLSSTQTDDPGNTRAHITTLADQFDMEDVWQQFLDAVHSSSLRKFLMTQGKLASLSMSKGFAVAHLEFGQVTHTSRAMRSKTSIAYAFHCTLGYPVDVNICLAPMAAAMEDPKRQVSMGDQILRSSNGLWHSAMNAKPSLMDPKVTEDEHSPQPLAIMSSVYPLKPHQQSNPSRPVLSFEILELNNWNSDLLPPSKPAKQKQAETMIMYDCNKDDDDGDGDESKHETTSSLNIFRSGGSELGYTMAQEAHSAMVAAQQLEEETMKLESKTGTSCWNAPGSGDGHSKAKHLQRTSKRSGLLLSLCPCATSSH
ncbi:hypothetical protein GOP47_0020993 [Adiantum capillus-veneris]|uniref:Uncharacterized protein n=1 Tax=Adiantum capillus-veneris TaxID=13818 RepID=A0A9D4UB68_ADICA|nr:hypothetical protein GOP47_0020993 [Adiantum capillus-veneris]